MGKRGLFGSSGLSNTCSKNNSYCSSLAFPCGTFPPAPPSGFHTDLMVAEVREITLIWRRLVSDADRHDQPNTSSSHVVLTWALHSSLVYAALCL